MNRIDMMYFDKSLSKITVDLLKIKATNRALETMRL